MKILISGATGFVGASLVRFFAKKGNEILSTGRNPRPPSELLEFSSYFPFDFSAGPKPFLADIAIHAAGLADDHATWEEYEKSNVTATKNFVLSAQKCERIVYISSSSVYDFSNNNPASESDNRDINRLSPYGKSKFLGEEQFKKKLLPGQRGLILRPRAIYGPGDRVLLPRLLNLEKAGILFSPIPRKIRTSLTHIDNLCGAIDQYVTGNFTEEILTLNISDDEIYNLRDVLISFTNAYNNRKIPIVDIPSFVTEKLIHLNSFLPISKKLTPMLKEIISNDSVLKIKEAKRIVHYKPAQNFQSALPGVIAWIKKFGNKQNYFDNLQASSWMHF
jgi:2-alkyl-3-oxoalkanoate reductase